LFFRKPGKEKLITLGRDGLYQAEYRTSMAGLYSEMEILSYNRDKKEEKKTSVRDPDKKTGKGKTASEILRANGSNLVLRENMFINNSTERDWQKLLQARIQENSMGFVKLELQTNGLPELVPGKILTLSEMGKKLDNDYYIDEIRHNYNRSGYMTHIECCSNTAL
jgi:hypothetical protein